MIFSSVTSPCADRPTYDASIPVERYCLERVAVEEDNEMAFTALAVSPDGVLYATRPLTGEVFAIEDTDGDQLPDSPRVIASGLTLPNALIFHDGALYISGGSAVSRLEDDELITLIDDLPAGAGFWTGGIAIGTDNRLYIGIGSNCDVCLPEEDRALILSYSLEGEDRQVVARGLRQPAGLLWVDDILWAVDSANTQYEGVSFGELNRIIPGEHYGYPYCYGVTNRRETQIAPFDCQAVIAPAATFPNLSNPLSLALYRSATFPWLNNTLLITLGGSYNEPQMTGYSLAYVDLGESAQSGLVIPSSETETTLRVLQLEGQGFYPHRVYGVAVSPEGWIYISSGGRIYALRPR